MEKSYSYQHRFISIVKHRIKTKKYLLLCLLSLLVSPNALAGWEINFIDKFSGPEVNWDNWTAQTDANFNNEVQCYTDDDSSAYKNLDVSDGTLKIIARKQQVSCKGLNNQARTWTSGRINGKDKREFLYGRIEARIRFHNLERGTWPAFWMLENRIAESPRKGDGDNSNWPNPGAGEIDVWEWFANSPSTYITNFFNTGGASCGNEVRFSYPNGASDVLNWHDYAIEWDENNISFYMDDTLVSSHNVSNCSQYKEPMFVLLNVAIGGNLGGYTDPNLNKATMEVDYLAHCTATNQNNANRCNENTPTVYADDDNDGIANDIDLCPSTLTGDSVSPDGCSINLTNVAPEVTLTMTQNNATVSTIDSTAGIVEIVATASDENIDDRLSYSWIIGGAIPSPLINGSSISFDPTSMVQGSAHSIEVTASDNGQPILRASDNIQFSVAVSDVKTTDNDSSSTSSGGSFNYLLLIMLIVFKRKRNYKTSY